MAKQYEFPPIVVITYCDPETLEDVFAGIATYEWIVFTSSNGVKCFCDLFFKHFKDMRSFERMRIACIGRFTAYAVERYHLQVDVTLRESVAEDFAAFFYRSSDFG